MVKCISVLGSTGSIGTQTLEVLRSLKEQGIEIKVAALAAGRNIQLIEAQAREFRPGLISVTKDTDAQLLRKRLKPLGIDVAYGEEGLQTVASSSCDMLVTAIVGMKGLLPTLTAIRKGTDIALANKETMVVAGELGPHFTCRQRAFRDFTVPDGERRQPGRTIASYRLGGALSHLGAGGAGNGVY